MLIDSPVAPSDPWPLGKPLSTLHTHYRKWGTLEVQASSLPLCFSVGHFVETEITVKILPSCLNSQPTQTWTLCSAYKIKAPILRLSNPRRLSTRRVTREGVILYAIHSTEFRACCLWGLRLLLCLQCGGTDVSMRSSGYNGVLKTLMTWAHRESVQGTSLGNWRSSEGLIGTVWLLGRMWVYMPQAPDSIFSPWEKALWSRLKVHKIRIKCKNHTSYFKHEIYFIYIAQWQSKKFANLSSMESQTSIPFDIPYQILYFCLTLCRIDLYWGTCA